MGLFQDLVYRAAKRWIAGKDMETALARAKESNARGLGTVLNYLGEDVSDPKVAEAHFDEYLRLQRAIGQAGIDGCISVKLTQFGLGVVEESAVIEKVLTLAQEAKNMQRTLWIDMESSRITSQTLSIYTKVFKAHDNVGVALQAYLKRSRTDIQGLMDLGAKVRMVKGAYKEPEDVAFHSRERISEEFLRLMEVLFERGQGFAVATHDSKLIDAAERLHASSPSTKFEFEMLRGIRDDLKVRLASAGHRVVDYMPYGEEWYPYSMRRIREHPSNIWLLLRSL